MTVRTLPQQALPASRGARQRILDTAYELFSRHGTRAVGIDRVVAESGVAKMTLYRHFRSKDDLVLAYLEERRRRWTQDWLGTAVESAGEDPRARILAIFDACRGWFAQPGFESCVFLRTLYETHGADPNPIYDATVDGLNEVRDMLAREARQLGVRRPKVLAEDLQMLAMGAIVAATAGRRDSARRARRVAEMLLDAAH